MKLICDRACFAPLAEFDNFPRYDIMRLSRLPAGKNGAICFRCRNPQHYIFMYVCGGKIKTKHGTNAEKHGCKIGSIRYKK